ncbi:hypothetical protein J7E71_05705 [Mesobacillus foraminis]|nr:hypothetical protein [Mesobacillus foraminis]
MKCRIYRCNCRMVWSVQTRRGKITAQSILLTGEWTTELRPDRSCNPKGFVTTLQSRDIIVDPDLGLVKPFEKASKLIYDKHLVEFNISQGKYLFFAEDGSCYILKRC